MSRDEKAPKPKASEFALHADFALHVGRPNIGDRKKLLERIEAALDRRWLTNGGPLVREFETRIAQMLGVRHCLAIANGTIALEILARAMNLTGEVIVPSFTFVATAHAFRWLGLDVVFCDVDPKTHTLDPARVEALITPRTSAIVGVHTWGGVCDVDALTEIAKRRNLKLLFDAAHAFGCSRGGEFVGGFGDAEIFSFHATKFVNCFEGGAIATNDDAFACTVGLMRNFGFVDEDAVDVVGTNGKMHEISAAMGLTSLDAMDEIVATNRRNHHAYRDKIGGLRGVQLYAYDESQRCNFQYVVCEIDAAKAGISRDDLLARLRAGNIRARRYFYPGCHHMEPYRTLSPGAAAQLPVTEMLAQRVLVLPTGTAVSERDIDGVCTVIREAIEG